MAPIPALLQAANFARHVGVLGPMTNLLSDPSSVSSSSHSRRGRRRSLAWAAGLTAAAALVLPMAADAHRFEIDDTGNATPLYEDFPDPEPTMPAVTADAAIVVDRATGAVLGSKSPDLRWAPASTTKIMTGLLAIEAVQSGAVSLDDTVTIRSDVGIEDRAAATLAVGDTISLRDLLNMALVDSAGDAAVAVGTYIGERVYLRALQSRPPGLQTRVLAPLSARDAFVARMNTRAAELGLEDTSYIDITGRDPEDLNENGEFPDQAGCVGNQFTVDECAHYTTARDLASLARVALDQPLFAAIVRTTAGTATTWTRPSGPAPDKTFTTTNQLLPGQSSAYPGTYGVKTGTTYRAGQNLV
jgi:serine-type D-Ala-D-Ala carboxypeptidase (penicillin-binding protein 5/6)